MNLSKSGIGYLDYVWNTTRGCTPVSEGCDHCYARAMHNRFDKPRTGIEFGNVQLLEDRIDFTPPRKPSVIGAVFMGDLFHEQVPDEFLKKIYRKIGNTPQHVFLLLTKRPRRMLDFFRDLKSLDPGGLFNNIWHGVTAENRILLEERTKIIKNIPGKRWVSLEPMLEDMLQPYGVLPPHLKHFDWIVCGPETGPGRRPARKEWFEDLEASARHQGVPFYDKGDAPGAFRQYPIFRNGHGDIVEGKA